MSSIDVTPQQIADLNDLLRNASKLLVYIAGPYTIPDPVVNTKKAVEIADIIEETGHAVTYVPHLSMFRHYLNPRSYEEWLLHGLAILKKCDCMVRIPGQSRGADVEQLFAQINSIPTLILPDSYLRQNIMTAVCNFINDILSRKPSHDR